MLKLRDSKTTKKWKEYDVHYMDAELHPSDTLVLRRGAEGNCAGRAFDKLDNQIAFGLPRGMLRT